MIQLNDQMLKQLFNILGLLKDLTVLLITQWQLEHLKIWKGLELTKLWRQQLLPLLLVNCFQRLKKTISHVFLRLLMLTEMENFQWMKLKQVILNTMDV